MFVCLCAWCLLELIAKGGGVVGIGVGGGSRRSGEEEAGGSTTGVWCLLELIAKAMTPHPSGSGRCIGYEWARH